MERILFFSFQSNRVDWQFICIIQLPVMVSQFQVNFSYQMKIEHLLWLFLPDRAPVSSQSYILHTHLKMRLSWVFLSADDFRTCDVLYHSQKSFDSFYFVPIRKFFDSEQVTGTCGLAFFWKILSFCRTKNVNRACSKYIFRKRKPECIKTNNLSSRVPSLVLDKIQFD